MWLSIFAYMIRIGAKLGLVETEPTTPHSRAYIRAHEGVHWLRSHLNGCRVCEVGPTRVRFRQKDKLKEITFSEGHLVLSSPDLDESQTATRLSDGFFFDPQGLNVFDLGPGGSAGFEYSGENLLATLEAADDTLGEVGKHKARITFVAPREPGAAPHPDG